MIIRKIFASLLALIQAFLINIGIMKPNGFLSCMETMNTNFSSVTMADDENNDFAASVSYAQGIKNVVQAGYTDSYRNSFRIVNGDMIFTHSLTDAEKTATLTDKNGNIYAENSFKSFYVDKLGVKHYFEKSFNDGRVNVIRLGEYYYECHIRDLKSGTFYVDKCLHTYADKLYMEYSVLASHATKTLGGFGSEISVPVSAVSSVEICDKNGVHKTLDGIDEQSVEYIAFDIENTGVLGFIIPNDGTTDSVVIKEKLGNYIITQYGAYDGEGLNKYDETGHYGNNKLSFGCRIYTDKTHDFENIRKENYIEKNPLDLTVLNDDSRFIGYEALRGTYTVEIQSPSSFLAPFYTDQNKHYKSQIKIEGDDADRSVYIRATSDKTGFLESTAVLDQSGTLSAIEVEVCKNFSGDGGEPIYSVKDYCYSDSFTPIIAKKNSETSFTVIHTYQNWGTYPLKQISSIEFHTAYYHLSTGVTESNCIAPYFVYGKDGWTLPDFRCRSGNIWETQPQFNSVGILKFMSYRDSSVKDTVYSEFTGSVIDSSGMTYADVTNYYTDDNGNYDYSLRHVEFPQTDENRTYYTLKVDFKNDVTYENFRKDFDIFYFDGRYIAFNKTDYLNSNNEPISADVSTKETFHLLGSEAPFIGFYQANDNTKHWLTENVGCNFALIIKNSTITVGGEEQNIPFVFRESGNSKLTSGALTLDAEKLSFEKGDSIEIDMILLPCGTGTEDDDANVLSVREDSVLKAPCITAKTGTVVQDTYLNTVKAHNGISEFTVSGGKGNIALKVEGFNSMDKPEIYILRDDEWAIYNTASENGYDGYKVHSEYDGTYSFSFVFTSTDTDGEQTFRVVQKQK